MTDYLETRLKQKGWSNEDVAKAVRALSRAEEMKSQKRKFFDSFVYWLGIIFCIVGSMFVGVAVVPFLLIMDGIWLFGFISLIAVSFGSLIGFLLNGVEKIGKQKTVVASIFIPFLALLNIYLITRLSNLAARTIGLSAHNPWLISIMYVWMFCLPYFAYKIFSSVMLKQPLRLG
ncbi:hypothetical protein HY486_00060 [Candidatus Woesearchaeota archaeon]|nr:hypothetical protein [Candidatus Woesearchaeota archaeon]